MMNAEPTTEGVTVDPSGQSESDWRQDFQSEYGVDPDELKDVDIEPFDPEYAVKRTFRESDRKPNISTYSAVAQTTATVTNEMGRLLEVIAQSPVGAIVSMSREGLHEPPNVVFFRKLENGKLAPLRSPRPVNYPDFESGGSGNQTSRGIADTVLD